MVQCRIDDGEFLIGQDLGAKMIAHGAKDSGEIIGTDRPIAKRYARRERRKP